MGSVSLCCSIGKIAPAIDKLAEQSLEDSNFSCNNMIEQGVVSRYKKRKMYTDACLKPEPIPCGGGKMDFRSFCEWNPKDAWCSDPCCSDFAASKMCCRAKKQSAQVYSPAIFRRTFGQQCKKGGVKTPMAIAAALKSKDLEVDVQKCFVEKDDKWRKQSFALRTAAGCCADAVLGVENKVGYGC